MFLNYHVNRNSPNELSNITILLIFFRDYGIITMYNICRKSSSGTTEVSLYISRKGSLFMPQGRIEIYKMLFTLLWCLLFNSRTAGSQCETLSLCIGNRTDCLSKSVNYTFDLLSNNITKEGISCKNVEIYLKSGVHYITTDLIFTDEVQQTTIQSISTAIASTIICRNASMIKFSTDRDNKVTISNIIFKSCNKERSVTWKLVGNFDVPVTLYFYKVHYKLEKVTIENTDGIGLFAHNCNKQVIQNCLFNNNSLGNIKIRFMRYRNHTAVDVNITNTTVSNGFSNSNNFEGGGGGLQVRINKDVQCYLTINNSKFYSNEAKIGSHILTESKENTTSIYIHITNSIFSEAKGRTTCGTIFKSLDSKDQIRVTIENSKFSSNIYGAIESMKVRTLNIRNCSVINNKGIGMSITFLALIENETQATIINSTFQNNFKALSIQLTESKGTAYNITISHCNFTDHTIPTSNTTAAVVEIQGHNLMTEMVVIEESYFERNRNIHSNCSALYLFHMNNIKLNNITLQDNRCTGITLNGSSAQIEERVTIVRNSAAFGGAIKMESSEKTESNGNTVRYFSRFTLDNNAILRIINNTATSYGGGIFTDETCENRNFEEKCLFQFKELHNFSGQLQFEGNRANIGGDIISKGCLSHCYLDTEKANATDNCNQLIWNLISSEKEQSSSTFAEYPKKVVFCQNGTECDKNHISCRSQHQVNAHPGQLFKVPLMVVDDNCIPSEGVIEAKGNGTSIVIGTSNETEVLRKSKKYCHEYRFTVIGIAPKSSVTIQLSFQRESPMASPPALLTVSLIDCPIGFKFVKEKCDCIELLESIKVECIFTDPSLRVPRLTWIGNLNRKVAVNQFCQHCQNEKKTVHTHDNATINSDILCKENRTGILCGACASNYSLQLGRYQCNKCAKSTYRGILLLLLFLVIGVLLIIILLSLNLTVSTGMINALIFYCNIVYSNRESFLPISTEPSNVTVILQLLSAFLAWINLDFGIVTCFFDGYNTYVSVWMQFLFPVYIWLLILLIVFASRYTKISKLTTSNTVPVLATLLLLSYTKLLLTSIAAFSFTNLQFLEDNSTHRVWLLDGNISYLKGKHIPLFIASILWGIGFILPFTVLILLGPILQAKSEYRFINWINKLKPLLDAFYGPYTSRYRYWPGILLLARVVLFLTEAFYSLGDGPFKLVVTSAIMITLLIIWILLAMTYSLLPYQSRCLNYLEIFFIFNLAIFAVASVYFLTNNYIFYQQVLAAVAVGAAYIVFCGILGYQTFRLICKFKFAKKFIHTITTRNMSRYETGISNDDKQHLDQRSEVDNTSTTPTQSTIEMNDFNELREPLLTN